jgi:hypothetical protein
VSSVGATLAVFGAEFVGLSAEDMELLCQGDTGPLEAKADCEPRIVVLQRSLCLAKSLINNPD